MNSIPQAERLTEDDRAQAATEQWLARALAQHALLSAPVARTLACLACGDSVTTGLYCCAECEEAHQRRMVSGVRA